MNIDLISMKNFQCYFGEHEDNKITFSDGLNLIIGDNGGGKSKLFDAFYWVIYNQIFQSDTRQMVSTKLYKEKLISDKAKADCVVGDEVKTEVCLEVTSANDRKYRLIRIFSSVKADDRTWISDNKDSTLLISEFKGARWQPVAESMHQKILSRVIPPHIKPYMWFQGEQVDSLMDLTNNSSLTQVVNLLSDIKNYDDLILISEAGKTKASSELKKAKNKLSRDENESNVLNNKLDNLNLSISNEEKDIESFSQDIEMANVKIEELVSKVDDAQVKADLKARNKSLTDEYKEKESRLNAKNNNFSKKIFTEKWILKNAEPFFKKYQEKYKKYNEEHTLKENTSQQITIKLPLNMPQPIHIERMIDSEECFVCGREAKKGSEGYEHLCSLIERRSKEDIFKYNCFNDFNYFYDQSLKLTGALSVVDNSIRNEFQDINALRSRLIEISSEIRDIDNQFDTLIEEDQSSDILGAYKQHSRNKDIFTTKKLNSESTLENLNKEKEEIENKINNLVTGEVEKHIVLADEIFSQLSEITRSTKQKVFKDIISSLECSSNDIFKMMAEKNSSIKGEIKLKDLPNGSYIPEIVDSDGFIINSPNDSNIILVKLSLIMAILTAKAKWSDNYTLISDAPTSKMAKNYTYGFYKTLSHHFTQSIVTTFDFIDNNGEEILKDFNLGKVYKIEPIYPNGDYNNRSDLRTKISEVLI